MLQSPLPHTHLILPTPQHALACRHGCLAHVHCMQPALQRLRCTCTREAPCHPLHHTLLPPPISRVTRPAAQRPRTCTCTEARHSSVQYAALPTHRPRARLPRLQGPARQGQPEAHGDLFDKAKLPAELPRDCNPRGKGRIRGSALDAPRHPLQHTRLPARLAGVEVPGVEALAARGMLQLCHDSPHDLTLLPGHGHVAAPASEGCSQAPMNEPREHSTCYAQPPADLKCLLLPCTQR